MMGGREEEVTVNFTRNYKRIKSVTCRPLSNSKKC